MIGWRKRVLLRHYLDEGIDKTELAERLGISRRTIYHWIETGQLDRDLAADTVCYGPRPPVPTKLDPFKGIILARLEQYPKLTAGVAPSITAAARRRWWNARSPHAVSSDQARRIQTCRSCSHV